MSSLRVRNSSRVTPSSEASSSSGPRPPSGQRPSGPPPRHRSNVFGRQPGAPPPRPRVNSLVRPETGSAEGGRARSSSATNGTEQRSASSEVYDASNEEMIELLESELAASGESERRFHATNIRLGDELKATRRELMEARRQLRLRDANLEALLRMREEEVARSAAQLEQVRGDLEIANARVIELGGQMRGMEEQNAALATENADLRRDLAANLNAIVGNPNPNPEATAGQDDAPPPSYYEAWNGAGGQVGARPARPRVAVNNPLNINNRNRSGCVIL